MPTILKQGNVKIIECPRDAMQGILDFIPTQVKIEYLNKLLKVGFDTIDCGSFVSPKAIPQMQDTQEVMENLDLESSDSKLSVIVVNERGANDAVLHPQVDYLGYPFSISEKFQQRNTNKSIKESLELVERINELTVSKDKEMVVYISMGFGNPYGEDWNTGIVVDWVGKLRNLGIKHFSISDTVGVSIPDNIAKVFSGLIKAYDDVEFGAHFHTTPFAWKEKVEAAYANGCSTFDGAIKGYGGCPMAKDELVGNMPTERLIEYFGFEELQLKKAPFEEAFLNAEKIFSKYQ
ncbi:MAG: hydroxymethylglutaryl-CoA lyase [Bacteroidia bacterium]|nr:hydroxymethylglutaryl-CoA lyase [Bacteroidia bacterium]